MTLRNEHGSLIVKVLATPRHILVPSRTRSRQTMRPLNKTSTTLMPPRDANSNGHKHSRRPWVGGTLTVAALSVAGWLLGGFPIWAARRILYPMGAEPLPQNLEEGLDLGIEAHPER